MTPNHSGSLTIWWAQVASSVASCRRGEFRGAGTSHGGGGCRHSDDTSLRRVDQNRSSSIARTRGEWMEVLAGRMFGTCCRGCGGGGPGRAAKLVRACGGCLGTRRRKGVEGCEKSGRAVKRALTPEYPSERRELKHLITSRREKKNRLRQ